MSPVLAEPAIASVEQFKRRTARKIEGLRCPHHHQPPRLRFRGTTLRDVVIQMSACCDTLMQLANRKIAEP